MDLISKNVLLPPEPCSIILLSCIMTFYEHLLSNGIDPLMLIELQVEFIFETRAKSQLENIAYRDYLEIDQSLTMLEKFVHLIEREILQRKINTKTIEYRNANSFYENLIQHNIRPEKFILVQGDFFNYFSQNLEKSNDKKNYRMFLERDQLLTIFEKFMSQVERERLQHKIIQITTPFSAV